MKVGRLAVSARPARRARRHLAVCLALCLAPLAAACGDAGRSGDGTIVRDSAGVTIVENDHTRTSWRDGAGWRLSADPIVQIGAVDGPAEQQLFRAVDARRLTDGTIAVANSGSGEVRVYDASGRHLSTIGGRGEGPGEFRAPWVVHELAGDSLLVIDLAMVVSMSVFDAEGNFVRRFRLAIPDTAISQEIEPVGLFGDGTLLFRGHFREQPGRVGLGRNRIRMMRFDLEGDYVGALGEFDDQTIMYGGAGGYAFGAWAKEAAADTTMWYAPGDRLELREVAFDGRTVRLIRLDRPNAPVTDADRATYRDTMLARYRGTAREAFFQRRVAATGFPEAFPAHYDVLIDAHGNLWVQDYRPFYELVPRQWSVLDPDGRYLGTVEVPPGVSVRQIGEDYVLGFWRDELDVEYVRVYRLTKEDRETDAKPVSMAASDLS